VVVKILAREIREVRSSSEMATPMCRLVSCPGEPDAPDPTLPVFMPE
jgi:hypothetical protein